MGSKRGYLSGADWADVAEMIGAFEEQNRVSIVLTLTSVTTNSTLDLCIRADAWEVGMERRGAKPLASQSVTWLAGQWKTMRGLVTYLLYQLDFQLADFAWQSVNGK